MFLTDYTEKSDNLQILNVVFFCPGLDNINRRLEQSLVKKCEELKAGLRAKKVSHILSIDGPVPERAEVSRWKVEMFESEALDSLHDTCSA